MSDTIDKKKINSIFQNRKHFVPVTKQEHPEVHTALSYARLQMGSKPFFSSLSYNLISVLAISDEAKEIIQTAAVAPSGGQILLLINEKFLLGLTPPECAFLLSHEIMHVVLKHINGRDKFLNPRLYNLAADFVINAILAKSNVGKMPPQGLLSPRISDETTVEKAYLILLEDMKNNGGKSSIFSENAETLDQHLETESEARKNKKKKQKAQQKKDNKANAGGDKKGDQNPGGDQPDDDADEGNAPGDAGEEAGTGFEIDESASEGGFEIDENELAEVEAKIDGMLKQAQSMAGGESHCPGVINRYIQSLNVPRIRWNTIIRRKLQSLRPSTEWTYSRPPRRQNGVRAAMGAKVILPSQRASTEEIRAVALVDSSGSISEETLISQLSEIAGIGKSAGTSECPFFCDVILFASEAKHILTLHSDMDDSEIKNAIQTADLFSGGTCPEYCVPVMEEKIKEYGQKYVSMIMLSDFYFDRSNFCSVYNSMPRHIQPDEAIFIMYSDGYWSNLDIANVCAEMSSIRGACFGIYENIVDGKGSLITA